MTEQIHNLYITSRNKSGSDTNHNYNIYFSNYNINIDQDEEAYLNITSFQSLNSFYNINSNSKSFIVRVRTDQEINFTYTFTLDDGNYDIFEFQEAVNNLCSTHFTITYNKNKNKWNYKATDINNLVYIKPSIFNYKYFGMKPDVFNEILYPFNDIGTYSSLINMNNFGLIIIKVIGLIEQNKCIDNFNSTISRGDTACIISRQDTSVGAQINWTSINNSFMKKISNREINQLNLQFFNEFNMPLIDLDEWVMCIQIIIKKKKQHLLSQQQME